MKIKIVGYVKYLNGDNIVILAVERIGSTGEYYYRVYESCKDLSYLLHQPEHLNDIMDRTAPLEPKHILRLADEKYADYKTARINGQLLDYEQDMFLISGDLRLGYNKVPVGNNYHHRFRIDHSDRSVREFEAVEYTTGPSLELVDIRGMFRVELYAISKDVVEYKFSKEIR